MFPGIRLCRQFVSTLPFILVSLAASADAFADPKTDYLLYCRGCHLADGSSVPPQVPTLLNVIGRIVATPEGRDYVIRVPGVAQSALPDKQLAAVTRVVNGLVALGGMTRTTPARIFAATIVVGNQVILVIDRISAGSNPRYRRCLGARWTGGVRAATTGTKQATQ